MKSLEIEIKGKVQGVFFRATAKEMADKLGLSGWARNEEDGTVLIQVEGENERVDEFLVWCHKGPLGAEIKGIEVKEKPVRGFSGFVIN